MGAYRYEREPPVPNSNKNVIEFDSSADRAIGRAYGFDIGTVELRQKSANERQVVYDVYAAEFTPEGSDPRPLTRRGTLKCLTRLELRRRQDANIIFGRMHG